MNKISSAKICATFGIPKEVLAWAMKNAKNAEIKKGIDYEENAGKYEFSETGFLWLMRELKIDDYKKIVDLLREILFEEFAVTLIDSARAMTLGKNPKEYAPVSSPEKTTNRYAGTPKEYATKDPAIKKWSFEVRTKVNEKATELNTSRLNLFRMIYRKVRSEELYDIDAAEEELRKKYDIPGDISLSVFRILSETPDGRTAFELAYNLVTAQWEEK